MRIFFNFSFNLFLRSLLCLRWNSWFLFASVSPCFLSWPQNVIQKIIWWWLLWFFSSVGIGWWLNGFFCILIGLINFLLGLYLFLKGSYSFCWLWFDGEVFFWFECTLKLTFEFICRFLVVSLEFFGRFEPINTTIFGWRRCWVFWVWKVRVHKWISN